MTGVGKILYFPGKEKQIPEDLAVNKPTSKEKSEFQNEGIIVL